MCFNYLMAILCASGYCFFIVHKKRNVIYAPDFVWRNNGNDIPPSDISNIHFD